MINDASSYNLCLWLFIPSLVMTHYTLSHTVLQFLVQLYLVRVRISCMFVTLEISLCNLLLAEKTCLLITLHRRLTHNYDSFRMELTSDHGYVFFAVSYAVILNFWLSSKGLKIFPCHNFSGSFIWYMQFVKL